MNIMKVRVIMLVLEGDGIFFFGRGFGRVLIPMMTLDRMKESKFLLHYMLVEKKTGKNQMSICCLKLCPPIDA